MNQDGPSLIIQAPPPPPPPPGPHIAKDVNIFTYMYNLLPLFFLVVHMSPV